LTPLGPGFSPKWSPDGTKISFDYFDNLRLSQVFLMNADGSGRRQITTTPLGGSNPSWSPDGRRIAFDGPGGNIFVMNADGGGVRQLTTSGSGVLGRRNTSPSWSPDGKWIAFSVGSGFEFDIHMVHPDGTSDTTVTNLAGSEGAVDWSPDGKQLAFSACYPTCSLGITSLYTVRPDGSSLTRLTSGRDADPSWSPDGTRIVFGSTQSPVGLRVMNADGSDQRLLSGAGYDQTSWQPIPGPQRSDYKNAAQFCKAERDFLWDAAFAKKYGTNANGANAYGKCVSAN
jgi:TolB protein